MMHKLNEDCYYFLTTSCTKGATCLYRHNPLALKSNVICPAWIRGQCLDAACPLRHTNAAQRPMASNGIMCFYENLPTGCLKVDCTFIHTRPRVHLTNPSLVRPPSMNLINKEVPKPVSTPSVPAPVPKPVEPTTNETPTTTATTQPDPSSPKRKAEIVVRRIALNTDNNASTEKTTNPSESSTLSPTKVTTRSVITSTPEEKPDETSNNANDTRIVVNRTAVRPEPVSTSTRKIVQATSSNRVVVASKPNTSSSSSTPASAPSSVLKVKRSTGKTDNFVEQENETKKFKADSSSITNNSTTNTRLLLLATKQITTTENEKTGPLKRNRLPAKKSTGGNVSVTVSISATEQKKSTGTGLLSQDDARRTSRLERFKSRPSSPPMPNTTQPSNSAFPSRNVVTLTVNGVKRAASVSITQNTPPAKRAPTKQQSTPIVQHAVVVKTSPSKATTTATPSRPRFVPQPIRAPSPVSTNKIKSTPVMIKRPPTAIPTSSETSQKSVNDDKSTNTSVELVKTFNEERADPLLKVNESNNVVDTFALIDAALLEADHLLNLI